jgi:DNA-binding NarL/FixJ family response regulator
MRPLRVAIFEDDPLIALDIQLAVEDAGCIVCGIFSDSTAAAAICEEGRPDLAIIDLGLLDGDTGAELATYMHNQGCEIVVFSGKQVVDPLLCRISHTFISKPLSPALLTAALRPPARVATLPAQF